MAEQELLKVIITLIHLRVKLDENYRTKAENDKVWNDFSRRSKMDHFNILSKVLLGKIDASLPVYEWWLCLIVCQ